MYIICYRIGTPQICACASCDVLPNGDRAHVRMANLDAFVRVELRDNERVIALGTNLMFEQAKTLFIQYKNDNCVVLKHIKKHLLP